MMKRFTGHSMQKMVRKLAILLIFFCCFGFCYAQNINSQDLISLDFSELIKLLNNSKDHEKGRVYAQAFLNKAKKEKNTLFTIGGYELLSGFAEEDEIQLKYLDSLIDLSRKDPDDFYPAKGYLNKGVIFYDSLDYVQSIENNLSALEYATTYPNEKFKHLSELGIALIKNRLGDFESAEGLHLRNLNYFKENIKTSNNIDHYINSLFGLTVSQLYLGKYEKVIENCSIGVSLSKKEGKLKKEGLFQNASGAALFNQKKYNAAIDSINKAIPTIREFGDTQNLIISHYYLYQCLDKTGAADMYHLEQIDSLVQLDNHIDVMAQDSYYHLMNFYERIGDKEKQLQFLKRIIVLDSTMDDIRQKIGLRITKEYDIPNMVSDKNSLITSLKKSNKQHLIYFLTATFFISTLSLSFYVKQRRLRQKFDELLEKYESKNDEGDSIRVSGHSIQNKISGVPEEIVCEITEKLSLFEKDKGFLDQNISLSEMAKKMNTNTSYLSKIINHTKNKSFARYVNDLRIDNAIIELKNNHTAYHKYTISAISSIMGFRSAETFSKLFKSKTGIYPSYFLKQLDKMLS